MFQMLKYFKKAEFKHPELMDEQFLQFLDTVRGFYGKPLKLNSDGRSLTENIAAKGSAARSAHLLGRAVDIDVDFKDYTAYTGIGTAILLAALKWNVLTKLGFEVVHEDHDSHIHLDLGGTFPDGYMLPRPKFILSND